MKIRDKVTIAASPTSVWPHVGDPLLMAAWNPKIMHLKRSVSGQAQRGERFEMIYRMKEKETISRVEVTELVIPRRIVYRHRVELDGRDGIFDEVITLKATGRGTKVTQVVDLSDAPIPWFLKPLIWFLSRFGSPTEEPYLERLARIVEEREPGA